MPRCLLELCVVAFIFFVSGAVEGKRANHTEHSSVPKSTHRETRHGANSSNDDSQNSSMNATTSTTLLEKSLNHRKGEEAFDSSIPANASSIEKYYKQKSTNQTLSQTEDFDNSTVVESLETQQDGSSAILETNITSSLLTKNESKGIDEMKSLNETETVNLVLDLEIDIISSRSVQEEPLFVGNVLKKGKLSNFFRACATVEEAAADENVYPISKRTCFRDSEYTDRIEFQYSYPPSLLDSANVVSATVEVQQTEKSVANAFIPSQDVGVLSDSQPKGRVTVYYGCRENGIESYILLFKMRNVTSEEVIKMTWEKTCRLGSSPQHVLVKSSYPSKESLLWPPNRDIKEVIVSPSEMTTSIEMSLGEKYNQQFFAAPVINSSDTDIAVATLRGTESKGGTLHSTIPVKFNVVYACKGTGNSEMHFSTSIPPFSNISFSWIKECGGIISKNLNIGTEPHGSDIASLGVVQDQYEMKDSELGLSHSEMQRHLESNLTHWKLYISTDTQMQEKDIKSFGVHMGHPVITVGNPYVVYASTSRIIKTSTSRGRSTYDYNDPTLILRDDEELEMTFSLVCMGIGESRIFISLPMLHYDAVEFGFIKVCDYVPEKKSRSSFNVRSVFKLLVLLLAAIGIAVGFKAYKARNSRIRYEGLDTVG